MSTIQQNRRVQDLRKFEWKISFQGQLVSMIVFLAHQNNIQNKVLLSTYHLNKLLEMYAKNVRNC